MRWSNGLCLWEKKHSFETINISKKWPNGPWCFVRVSFLSQMYLGLSEEWSLLEQGWEGRGPGRVPAPAGNSGDCRGYIKTITTRTTTTTTTTTKTITTTKASITTPTTPLLHHHHTHHHHLHNHHHHCHHHHHLDGWSSCDRGSSDSISPPLPSP